MQRHSAPRRQFVAIDEIRSSNIFITAEYDACKPIEAEVDGQAAQGSLLDRAKSRFRQITKGNASGGSPCCGERQGEEAFVAEARGIQAEAAETRREGSGAAQRGLYGRPER